MANYILRRRGLGKTSCGEVARYSQSNLIVKRNDDPPTLRGGDKIIRWGCTSNLLSVDHPPTNLCLNKPEAIHAVNDKSEFRLALNIAELCPKTWWLENQEEIRFPCVVRPSHHAQGKRLYVCNNTAELNAAIARCGAGWYASELINKVAEYRVFVANGRVVWVAKKTPSNPAAVAWNVARGGRFDNVGWDRWPLKAIKYSIKAFMLSGLEFGGVDVMLDAEGNCYVLEINSAPSQTSPYRQQCTAKAIDYLLNISPSALGLINRPGGYRKFIHPAICNEAIV